MAIGSLSDKIAQSDINRVKDARNPPDNEPGFEEEDSGEDSFMSMFGDDDMDLPGGDTFSFGDSDSSGGLGGTSDGFGGSSSGFGGSSSGFGNLGGSSMGGFGGSSMGGFGGLGTNPFGGANSFGGTQQNQQAPAKPDTYDKLFEASATAVGAISRIICQACTSIKNRTADDWGYFSAQTLKISLALLGIGALITVLGYVGNIEAMKFAGLPVQIFLAALCNLGLGCVGLGASAFYIEAFRGTTIENINDIPDLTQQTEETNSEYEDELSGLLDDLFGDEEDSFGDDDDDNQFEQSTDFMEPAPLDGADDLLGYDFENDEAEAGVDMVDTNNLDRIPSNVPLMTRKFLFETFKPFFPKNTPDFAKVNVIEPGTDEFYTIEALCLKALASAARMEYEDATKASELISAKETLFTYELRIKRIKGLTKLMDIEKEIVAYFKDSSDDTSVSCQADLEGDFYKLTINKGVQAIVTIGDLLALKNVEDHFLDESNKLPVIAGISESGVPILADAKNQEAILIAGRPRSGKSWYLLSLLWEMMVFNTPDDLQLLIIDPKESNLFKTLSLMPHVCGLHNDSNILSILRDIIEVECKRRKQLLADNKADNIWDLRKKGIMLPVLYIVIDEVMTVLANLGANDKEFKEQMKVIVTQFPSQGVRLIIVPHRAQGVIDKTIRTNMSFTAAVRATNEVVNETLDIPKWTRPLLNPGDMALRLQGFGKEMFVRSPAVTKTDDENTELIENVAKAFYKMGVSIPDMSTIGCGYNRDIDRIKEELGASDSKKVQFDLDAEAESVDLDREINEEFIE